MIRRRTYCGDKHPLERRTDREIFYDGIHMSLLWLLLMYGPFDEKVEGALKTEAIDPNATLKRSASNLL
jgi:hypothetical protein